MTTKIGQTPTRNILWTLLVLAIFYALFYNRSFQPLLDLWLGREEGVQSYGFLVLASTLYLLYLKADRFKQTPVAPNPWAGLLVLSLSAIWVAGVFVDVQTIHVGILPFIWFALVSFWLGNRVLKLILMPVGTLIFTLPIWWPLTPILQDAATLATEFNLKVIGKPVFVEGNILRLPGGTFEINDSCSGLRFLLVTLILSFISIDMFSLSLKRGVLLFSLGVVLALIANWIRVLIVVLVGDYTEMRSSLVADHYTLGWIVYGVVVLIPFFVINNKMSALPVLQSASTNPVELSNVSSKNTNLVSSFIFTCCLMASGPAILYVTDNQEGMPRSVSSPQAIPPWVLQEEIGGTHDGEWRPGFLNADNYLDSEYINGNISVKFHRVYYANQRQRSELINQDNVITDDKNWLKVAGSEDIMSLDLGSGIEMTLLTMEIRDVNERRKLVWYWYDVGGRVSTNSYIAKLQQVFSIVNGRTDANLISVSVDCEDNCAEKSSILNGFLMTMYPAINSSI